MAAQYDVILQSVTPRDRDVPLRTPLGALPIRGGIEWSVELNNSGSFRFEVDGQAISDEVKDRLKYPRRRPTSEIVIYRTEDAVTQVVQAGPVRVRTLKGVGATADQSVEVFGEGYLSLLKEMTYHNTGQIQSPLDQYAMIRWLVELAQGINGLTRVDPAVMFPGTDFATTFPYLWDQGIRVEVGTSGVMRQPGRRDPITGAFIEKPLWVQDGEYLFDIITRYSEGELGFDFHIRYDGGQNELPTLVLGDNPLVQGAYLTPYTAGGAANRTLLKGYDKSETVVFDSQVSDYELVSSVAVGSTAAVALAVGPGRGEQSPIEYVDDQGRPVTDIADATGTQRVDDRHDPRIYAHAYDTDAFAALGHRVKVLYFDDVFQGRDDGRILGDPTDPNDRIGTIAEKARGVIEVYRNQYELLRADIISTEQQPVTAYDVGDTIGYRLDTVLGDYSVRGRILKKTVNIAQDGQETAALELLSVQPVT